MAVDPEGRLEERGRAWLAFGWSHELFPEAALFDVVRDFWKDEAFVGQNKVLLKYLKPDMLIIDDMGSAPPGARQFRNAGHTPSLAPGSHRSKKMLGQIWSHPASAWRRITLASLTRTFRTPRVLDQSIHLPDYEGLLRQVTVIDLGHEEPTILLTNIFRISWEPRSSFGWATGPQGGKGGSLLKQMPEPFRLHCTTAVPTLCGRLSPVGQCG